MRDLCHALTLATMDAPPGFRYFHYPDNYDIIVDRKIQIRMDK